LPGIRSRLKMDRSLSASADAGVTGPIPATPRPASTVIVVRDGDDGRPETFMVRRDPRSRFAADAFVFPGGTVQVDDRLPGGEPPCSGLTRANAHRRLSERGGDPPENPGQSLALHIAAIRELFEEAGILLARHVDSDAGAVLSPDTCALLEGVRPAIQRGERALADVVSELGLELMPEDLVYFSHWITPESSPRRFDTRFFTVEDRPGQTASYCGVETIDGIWITPADAIRRFEADEITLVSVTVDHLRVLARYQSTAELLAFARTKAIRTVRARRNPASPDGWDRGSGGAPW
jgi:8-oxo-dGTP pyrophosphatase MutT (NUDIX family)